jgi:tetratricopeptide (TPR) repeat protein
MGILLRTGKEEPMEFERLWDAVVEKADNIFFLRTPDGTYAFERSESGGNRAFPIVMAMAEKRYRPGYAEEQGGMFVGPISNHQKQFFMIIGATEDYDREVERRAAERAAEKAEAKRKDAEQKAAEERKIAEVTEAIDRDPNNAGAYAQRGNAYFLKKEWARAAADLKKAVELKPDSNEYRKALEKAEKERNVFNAAVIGAVVGAAAAGIAGANIFGIIGAVLGGVLGLVAGFFVVCIAIGLFS